MFVVPCQPLETFYTQARLLQLWKSHCCHSAILSLVYISVNYSRLSLVVCHAVGTLHCPTPILMLGVRIGALKI